MRYVQQSSRLRTQAGYLLILVLVFGSVFFTIMAGIIGYAVTQSQVVTQRYLLDMSSEIAEAGLNYYKWYLAHYPDDVTNGTGLPGPYVHQYFDPEGAAIGEFSLSISSSTYCGDVAAIEVSSTGYTYENPSLTRTLTARYAQPTVAEYAFIINSNVWAGDDRTIVGPYHSNQGIRMDGTNLSTVTSGQDDWTCTGSFGCSPSQTVPGVYTTSGNANESLFAFPSSPINFTDLTIDLAAMQDRAQNAGGIYIPNSGNYGYRVTFNGDGTVTVRRVTGTTQYWAYSNADGWFQERRVISATAPYGTYPIDQNCPLIYIADNVWLEGTVDQKVSLAAAGTDAFGNDPTIVLQGNIEYNDPETDGLLAIAEDDVLLGVDVPDAMTVNGIFVAQNGRYGRNSYCHPSYDYNNCIRCTASFGFFCVSWADYSMPTALQPYTRRTSLSMTGTIVSNGRVGTKWSQGGTFTSGFATRTNAYDRNLVNDPPPLIPNTSDVYEFTEWQEVD